MNADQSLLVGDPFYVPECAAIPRLGLPGGLDSGAVLGVPDNPYGVCNMGYEVKERISAVTVSTLPGDRLVEITVAVNGGQLQTYVMSYEVAAEVIGGLARGIARHDR